MVVWLEEAHVWPKSEVIVKKKIQNNNNGKQKIKKSMATRNKQGKTHWKEKE